MKELTQEKSDEVFKLYPTLYLDDLECGNEYYKMFSVFYDRYLDEYDLIEIDDYFFEHELVTKFVHFFKKIKMRYDIYMIQEDDEEQIKIFEFENEFEFLKKIYKTQNFRIDCNTIYVIPELKSLFSFGHELVAVFYYPFEHNTEVIGLLESFEREGFNVNAHYHILQQDTQGNEL